MSEKKNKILVADDEKEIRDILKLLLNSEGYEVTLACDGQEVLDLADDSFDMFILDVNMPKISGFSAGAKLREKYFVPMIFLTAYAGESDKAMGFAAGADDYLTKPFFQCRAFNARQGTAAPQPAVSGSDGTAEHKRIIHSPHPVRPDP